MKSKNLAPWAAPLLALTLSSCSREPQKQTWVDVVAEFDRFETIVETGLLDLGTDDARGHMFAGFGRDFEDKGRNDRFTRSVGSTSKVNFEVLTPRNMRVRLHGRPIPRSAAVEVEALVNGQAIATFRLRNKLSRYVVKVPRSAVERGLNQLELRYRGDHESIAWYQFSFGLTRVGRPPPTANESSRRLFIPYGSGVSIELMAPPGSTFEASKVEFRGREAGELVIKAEKDGGAEATARFEGSSKEEKISHGLDLSEWTPTRLSIEAHSAATEPDPRQGVALFDPQVRVPSDVFEAPSPIKRASDPPNVIVYLIDTLRSDHLGCYGYDKPISPAIDAFASHATLFENSVAQTSWTRTAVASIFTGSWPAAHGVNGRLDRMPERALTISEILKEAGYETMGVVTNPNVHRRFGMAQGFDRYEHLRGKKPSSTLVNEEFFELLSSRPDPDRPFFSYLHTVDPHDPYVPPEEYRARFAPGTDEILALPKKHRWRTKFREGLLGLYDAEIAYNDRSFGELIDDLKGRGLYEKSLIILTSDHGEEFLEHGSWTHGRKLFSESIRVPLIIKWPGQTEGVRRRDLAQHIDIPSTILAVAGTETPESFEGRSLEVEPVVPPTALSYLKLDGPLQMTVIQQDWKLMVRSKNHTRWLFDLAGDPGEAADRSRDRPVRFRVLDQALARGLESQGYWLTVDQAEIDEQLAEELRALGYLN